MLFEVVFLDFQNFPKWGRRINDTDTKMNGISKWWPPHCLGWSLWPGLVLVRHDLNSTWFTLVSSCSRTCHFSSRVSFDLLFAISLRTLVNLFRLGSKFAPARLLAFFSCLCLARLILSLPFWFYFFRFCFPCEMHSLCLRRSFVKWCFLGRHEVGWTSSIFSIVF